MKIEINGKEIYLDPMLKQKLDNVKKIIKKDWDCVFLIDGIEGSGKSTLSFICGWYISEGKITIKNICEGSEDAIKKLENLPDKSILIIDEGSLMFSSKDVMKKEQKSLIKILQVIRQKMMCLIIVSPSFFDLNKYISVSRSRFLLHVYTDKELNRGRYSFFSTKKKKTLYNVGKKEFNSYQKPKADFIGRFTKFDPFGEEYQELKRKSLMESFKDKEKDIAPTFQNWLKQRNFLMKYLIECKKENQSSLSRLFAKNNIELPRRTISGAIRNVELVR